MIKDLKAFCHYFYATTFIPISLHHNGRLVSAWPNSLYHLYSENHPNIYVPRFSENPDIHVTDSLAYLGYIQVFDSTDFLLVGPVFSTPVNNDILHTFYQEFIVTSDKRTEITQFISSLPLVSYTHFLGVLSFLHLCLNDETVNSWEHAESFRQFISSGLETRHLESTLKSKEEHTFHNTYLYERDLFSYVQRGDEHGLKEFTARSSVGLVEGTLSHNPLRQMKNIFITTATQATRAAIAGGLDTEQAYQLSDIYIQECERLQDINAISLLNYSMLLDFTARVSKSRIPQGMSQEIFQCVQFISCHTADSISIDDVVAHVGRSRSYLTKKFKKELGFDMGAFIMNCKLEEAKSLLTHTTKSLSEISNYLCFSSQSYFQTVFRKKFGMTPLQYRRDNT